MRTAFFRLLTELSSRKTISRLAGRFAKSAMSRLFIPRFAKLYGIRIDDAEKPVHEYTSLNDFFTRRLKAGLRPIDADTNSLISPVDATITGIGPIEAGMLLNVKGQDYSLEDLLNHSPRAVTYRNGYFFMLYLSPTDYHRIHSPAGGRIVETDHVPGKVYPVNEFGMLRMRRVLSRNERKITFLRNEAGEIAIVKVGAMNVASIRYAHPLPEYLERGDDLAYFEFGSTVVLLMESGIFEPRSGLFVGSRVKMGENLGLLNKRNGKRT